MSKPAPEATAETPTLPNRQMRRKQKTRARLLKAANQVFLAKGVSNASVSDITEEADMAYGTFYNYFDSVEDIVSASVVQVLEEINDQIQIRSTDRNDPAIEMAAAMRTLFYRVVTEPAFNWLRHKPDLVAEIIFDSVATDAARDIARGIESGDFNLAADFATTQKFCVWGFTGAMRQLSDKPCDIEHATEEVTRILLRILGVSDAKANKVIEATRVST